MKILKWLVIIFVFLMCLSSIPQGHVIKKLKDVKEYQIPICKNINKQCLGYSHVDVGLQGIVYGIFVKDHYAYILDGRYNNVAKLDLRNGKIIGKSSSIVKPIDGFPCLNDFFSYNDNVFFLSECTGDILMLDTNLNITKIHRLQHGMPMKIVHIEGKLYVIQLGRGETNDSMFVTGYSLQPDLSVQTKEMMIHKNLYWMDTLIFGNKVSLQTCGGIPYLKTHKASYELPEIIPDFDYFDRNVGYNEQYLVYSVLKKNYYRIVVCSY